MIPFKVLCLLWQLKGKTLTTEVSSFISSASLHFAVVFYAWTKQKLEPAYSGSDAPHMLGYLTVPLFIFSNENKVTTTSYRDLLGQMTFYLCVRDKEFLFFFFFSLSQCYVTRLREVIFSLYSALVEPHPQ